MGSDHINLPSSNLFVRGVACSGTAWIQCGTAMMSMCQASGRLTAFTAFTAFTALTALTALTAPTAP
jgi:hypothetical protein